MRAASLQASSCLPPSASHSLTSSIFFLSSKRILKSLKKKQLPFLVPFFCSRAPRLGCFGGAAPKRCKLAGEMKEEHFSFD